MIFVKEYLSETPSIDYMNSHIQEKTQELMNQSSDTIDYIKRSYIFVRDEIPHSWDIKKNIVSKTTSETLIINWGMLDKIMPSCSTLKGKSIPSGISYQLFTRADDDSEGIIYYLI